MKKLLLLVLISFFFTVVLGAAGEPVLTAQAAVLNDFHRGSVDFSNFKVDFASIETSENDDTDTDEDENRDHDSVENGVDSYCDQSASFFKESGFHSIDFSYFLPRSLFCLRSAFRSWIASVSPLSTFDLIRISCNGLSRAPPALLS